MPSPRELRIALVTGRPCHFPAAIRKRSMIGVLSIDPIMASAKDVAEKIKSRTRQEERPPYDLEFYRTEDGREPAREFLQSLPKAKREAMGVAIFERLEQLGMGVCGTDFGKNLGEGLCEFRVDNSAEEVLRKSGKTPKARGEEPAKVLIRLFFHAHGDKVVLLLSGYDKAEHPSAPYQNAEIEEARALLKDWKRRMKLWEEAQKKPKKT
jgi:putative component of toxin-antitoxin plasmid stabilization module